MQKIRLFFILFMLPLSLLAQQRTKIILQHADKGSSNAGEKASYFKNPIFRHLNAVMTCDSAVLYQEKNTFEAFNNVHIVQGDTINIYSDHLVYDGNTKIAHLTSNVRMIDKESVLTTNILDYNMGSKVGTYVEGGKIVNKDVTLTSKNGYYFSNSRDAYFRYNVVVVTPESRITSDTMRYNTLTNWSYFYGPTNIKGKGDNLYTENGAYNTKTEYAYFGKKNLYTNASKSLKGDSLYYDGKAGYGKAVRNIIFKDTADKTVLYGQLGYYYKIDERALVTKNAYVGMGTKDSVTVNKKLVPDSIWMGADTLETQMVLRKTLKLIEFPVLKKDNELGEEEKPDPKTAGAKKGPASARNKLTAKAPPPAPPKKKLSRKERKAALKGKLTDSTKIAPLTDSLSKDSLLKIPGADSLIKSLAKDTTLLKKADSLANAKGAKDLLKAVRPGNVHKTDSLLKKNPVVKKTADTLLKKGAVVLKKTDSALLKKGVLKDTVPPNPLDTVKTRSIKAYHHVRVFKSNMQAVADSLFYTAADSTLRWYGSPILWSQGSQQTGDTIYVRLKNNKLNTLQVLENGFMVNVNADSAKFNQVKGKLITAFFKDGEMSNMFVDGNAESIYYTRDKDSVYTDMSQTVSARIKILFKNKEITDLLTIKDPEGVRIPVKELTEEKMLTGFIWRPEFRPLSKKEVITGKAKAKPGSTKEKSAVKKITVKNGKAIETIMNKAKTLVPDSLKKEVALPDSIPDLSGKIDSLQKKVPALPVKPGSVPAKVDSLSKKLSPVIKKADSAIKKDLPVPLKKQ
ncbi:MAG TPA: OstA-like protein [Pedobacter sp.]|nr:OstA-like protein [Pedobacter sp.]